MSILQENQQYFAAAMTTTIIKEHKTFKKVCWLLSPIRNQGIKSTGKACEEKIIWINFLVSLPA